MNTHEIRQCVQKAIIRRLGFSAETVALHQYLKKDLGLDELDVWGVTLTLERKLDICISDEEVTAVEKMTVAQLMHFVEQKIVK